MAAARTAAALALAAVLGGGAALARPGEVVRVERPRRFSGTSLRVCPVNPLVQDRLTCYGRLPPDPGTTYLLVDGKGVRGTVVARRVQPSEQDFCGLGYAHDVFVDGSLALEDASISVAIQGLGGGEARVLTPRQRPPSGRADEQVWMAIDRDGDELADVIATYRECPDADGAPLPPPGKTLQALCLDYWVLRGGDWRQVSTDVFFACR